MLVILQVFNINLMSDQIIHQSVNKKETSLALLQRVMAKLGVTNPSNITCLLLIQVPDPKLRH